MLNRAYILANLFSFLIEDYYDAIGQSSRGTIDHLDGTIKPKVRLMDNTYHDGTTACAVTCPDGVGRGLVVWDNPGFLQSATDAYWRADPIGLDRLCITLDVAAVIVHETAHLARRDEMRALSLEGYFRFHVQNNLGIASNSFCGLASWPCGTSTTTAACDTGAELTNLMNSPFC